MRAGRRIAFVYAPQIYYEQIYGARFVPLWAYTLASHVPESWDIAIHDCTFVDPASIPEADLFVFSGINQDLRRISTTFALLKRRFPKALYLLGGPITWSYEQKGRLEELPVFDHLFILDGEDSLPAFLRRLEAGGGEPEPRILRAPRFDLAKARRLRFDLLAPHVSRYYGGVVEVSRGCPFLCEFCDIRVLPDNNETHAKSIGLILEELDEYHRLGFREVQFACDNLIGDPVWAESLVDAVLAWTERTGAQVALFTWCTLNIVKFPQLMTKMRRAGFTTLFIGVESFNTNSILETAKVQNDDGRNPMSEALRTIQSYGFIITPGLIFGFDSDPAGMFDDMLAGVLDSGLIAGDPTFLLALPGTPLFSRMKQAGRLVEDQVSDRSVPLHKERVSKVESNIRYLQPRNRLVDGYSAFIREFKSPDYALSRLRRHVEILVTSPHTASSHALDYGNFPKYLRLQLSSWGNLKMLFKRAWHLARPRNLPTLLKAYLLVARHRRRHPDLANRFSLWLFFWSNLLMKYDGLKPEDFIIHSVEEDYDLGETWKFIDAKETGLTAGGRNADNVKVAEQQRRTKQALQRLKASFSASPP